MDITDKNIDGGKAFDWGKTSSDTQNTGIFIRRNSMIRSSAADYGITVQRVLDIGTGTGVLLQKYVSLWSKMDRYGHIGKSN